MNGDRHELIIKGRNSSGFDHGTKIVQLWDPCSTRKCGRYCHPSKHLDRQGGSSRGECGHFDCQNFITFSEFLVLVISLVTRCTHSMTRSLKPRPKSKPHITNTSRRMS